MLRSATLLQTLRMSASPVIQSAAPALQRMSLSSTSDSGSSGSTEMRTVTLFEGDGIGPEISRSVIRLFEAANIPIRWDPQFVSTKYVRTTGGSLISDEALDSVRRNRVALKGPLETPIGKGHKSLNLTLRQALGLYANVRPARSINGGGTPYKNVNLVTVRENTEGEYSGLEHEVVPGVVESVKVITRAASRRIAKYAFEYALNHNRKKVSAIHKASVQKTGDGMFLDCCREFAQLYPSIEYDEVVIDTCVFTLVQDPSKFDVMVMPNLYGDIVSDLCAGLVGGLGLTGSGNYGTEASVFEAVHGTAPDIAGKNLANPTALLFSAVMMLHHMGMSEDALRIEAAVLHVIKEGRCVTRDLGGTATCSEYTNAIISNLGVPKPTA